MGSVEEAPCTRLSILAPDQPERILIDAKGRNVAQPFLRKNIGNWPFKKKEKKKKLRGLYPLQNLSKFLG